MSMPPQTLLLLRYPSDPVGSRAAAELHAVDGSAIVFDVVTADDETPAVVTLVCHAGPDWLLRAAARSIRRWRFEPGAVRRGQVELRFEVNDSE